MLTNKLIGQFLYRNLIFSSFQKQLGNIEFYKKNIKIIFAYFFCRFDCYPAADVDQSKCESRGCCWNPPFQEKSEKTETPFQEKTESLKIGTPFCFYPAGYEIYSVVNRSNHRHGSTFLLKRTRASGYPNDVDVVKVEMSVQKKHRIRVKVRNLDTVGNV